MTNRNALNAAQAAQISGACWPWLNLATRSMLTLKSKLSTRSESLGTFAGLGRSFATLSIAQISLANHQQITINLALHLRLCPWGAMSGSPI